MLETIAVMLVGMGLMLYGMKMLGSETTQLTGRRLRLLMGKWSGNRPAGILFGLVSGALTHSGSSASLIMTNLVLGRLIHVKNALLILAAANVGTVVIVFLTSMNIKLGIMYLLGITALLYSLNKKASKAAIVRVFLGIGILLYGFHELEAGAEHLLEMEAVGHWLEVVKENYLLGLFLVIIGFILRFLTQSSSTVAVLAISLGHAGILTESNLMLIIAGAPIGAGVAMIFESKHVKGSTRQIPVFQIFFEFCGGAIFILFLLTDFMMGSSIIRTLTDSVWLHGSVAAAMALLLIRIIPFILTLIFHNSIARSLEKAFPPIEEETLSSPLYIYDHAVEDPETAVELVEKEVFRVVERFPDYLENVRGEHEEGLVVLRDNDTLHKATAKLGVEINSFIKELFDHNMSHEASERLLKVQNQHSTAMLMEENIHLLVKEIKSNPIPADLESLRTNIVESLHTVLVIFNDSIHGDDFARDQLIHMTSDKGGLMERLRNKYLSDYEDSNGNTKKTMMYVTDLYQRMIWQVNKWVVN